MCIINAATFNNAIATSALIEASDQMQAAQDARDTAYNEYKASQDKVVDINNQISELQTLVALTSGTEKQEAKARLVEVRAEASIIKADRDAKWATFLETKETLFGLQEQFTLSSQDTIGISLCNITSILSGGIAKTIATIALVSVGVSMLLGKTSWMVTFTTSAGVVTIFSTQKIIQFITGGSGASNACIFSG